LTPKPLSDDQIEILEGLLDEFESDREDGHMEAEEMEGFLVAALTPLDIRGEEVTEQVAAWLPFMLGVDEADDRAQLQGEIGQLVARHAIYLQHALEHDIGLDPILTVDLRNQVTGSGWAHGYLRGMALDVDFWQALVEDEDEGDFLEPMLRLSGIDLEDTNPEIGHAGASAARKPLPKLKPHQYDGFIDAMLANAAFAYQWFRD
jgi:yecA family protein